MRILTVLLLSTCLASGAFAQAVGGRAPDVAATTAAPATASATAANGKIQIGYEGRGDYLKNEEIAKQLANPERYAKKAAQADANTKQADATSNGGRAAANDDAAPTAQHSRSDSGLRSDTAKPKRAVDSTEQTKTTAQTQPVAAAQPVQAAPYSPPVYVGGKLQR